MTAQLDIMGNGLEFLFLAIFGRIFMVLRGGLHRTIAGNPFNNIRNFVESTIFRRSHGLRYSFRILWIFRRFLTFFHLLRFFLTFDILDLFFHLLLSFFLLLLCLFVFRKIKTFFLFSFFFFLILYRISYTQIRRGLDLYQLDR